MPPRQPTTCAFGDTPDFAVDTAKSTETVITPEDRASFHEAWEIDRDSHWDPNLGAVKWEAPKDELSPRVEAAKYRDEARSFIETLLRRLTTEPGRR